MAKKPGKRKPTRKTYHVKLGPVSSCSLYASYPLRCMLCRVMVPPFTLHQCEVKDTNAQARG